MTRYTVVWPQSVQDELADIWLGSPDRAAVTSAVAWLDGELAEDAPRKGTEVSEGFKALFVSPLRVLFAVREEDRVVEVLRVRRL